MYAKGSLHVCIAANGMCIQQEVYDCRTDCKRLMYGLLPSQLIIKINVIGACARLYGAQALQIVSVVYRAYCKPYMYCLMNALSLESTFRLMCLTLHAFLQIAYWYSLHRPSTYLTATFIYYCLMLEDVSMVIIQATVLDTACM